MTKSDPQDIAVATASYEHWLGEQIPLLADDLARKHDRMAESPFAFLRATFYRWMQVWPVLCANESKAPEVLAIGDLHIENFGTWRDLEGRLVWGANDFDEAYPLPYTIDLVRLAASAILGAETNAFEVPPDGVAAALLAGYVDALDKGGEPFVLDGSSNWLRTIALAELHDPQRFWEKMSGLPDCAHPPSRKVIQLLQDAFPEKGLTVTVHHRTAGLGSLGRNRFVALANWHGSTIAREAKALAPSACAWATGASEATHIRYNEILQSSIRCPDPFVWERDGWAIRRLAPDCSDIDLGGLPKDKDKLKLLRAMGAETGNIHLGSAGAVKAIRKDLAARPSGWLEEAARRMAKAMRVDWTAWKSARDSAKLTAG